MSAKEVLRGKKYVFSLLLLVALTGAVIYCASGREKVRCVTGINNREQYYLLEFETMTREEHYIIPACKEDVFSVRFNIEKGHVDFIIAADGKMPIYKGNDIDYGIFDVTALEDGEYRIIIHAKGATGSIEITRENRHA